MIQKYYRFIHTSSEIRSNSSSGGAFTLISDSFLKQDGVLYGCVFNEGLKTFHISAITETGRNRMRKAKYIQSDMRDAFSCIESDLKANRKVLFSGTPCQVSAVMHYLNKKKIDRNNLLLLEVVCHGVGSNRFFRDYINHLEKRFNSKAVSVDFRAKMKKGQKQDMKINFANGEMYHAYSTRYDWFYSVYLRNFILRPSCYECPFAQQERYADITLADHWGYNDDGSYSLIVTNTRKGDVFINQWDESVVEIPISEVNQPHMYRPCAKPDRRELFWSIYLERGYLDVQKWIGNNTLKGKVKDNLARMFYSIGIASLIKKLMRIGDAKK